MKRGGKFLVSTTILAVGACGGQDGKLEIRTTPTPLAQGKQPVPQRIAEARGQLALGNVALALEAFRLAAREDPNSIDALAGIASCYDRMGRYDLSRRNYEAALALAPADVGLLGAFAASLQLQGRSAEAISVRQEIAARAAAAAPTPVTGQVAAITPPPPVVAGPEVELAPPSPIAPIQVASVKPQSLAPVPTALPSARLQPAAVVAQLVSPPAAAPAPSAEATAASKPAPLSNARSAAVPQKLAPPPLRPVQTAELGPSVTIKLPSPRPVQPTAAPATPAAPRQIETPKFAPAAATPASMPTPAPAPMPAEAPAAIAFALPVRSLVHRLPEPAVAEEKGPRLERISMSEIALITSVGPPIWRSTTVARSDRSTTLRFVPLRQASAQPVKVRLLNAARVNRLAARTRTWLNARGYRGLSIGNASATRTRSVILYPAGKRAFAQRLSAQFGFPLARRASGAHVTVLLGADAVRHRASRSARA